MSGSSSSDSDSAFEEEVVVQRYLKQDLKSGLAQGRALLRHHDGVKPQPGHYKVSITPYPRAKVKLQSGHYKVSIFTASARIGVSTTNGLLQNQFNFCHRGERSNPN